MRQLLLFIFCLIIQPAGLVQAREEIAGPVTAEILRVVDGDTILVEARPWPQQTMEVYVRIRGIDTAELHSQCTNVRASGEQARRALEAMISASPQVQLTRISGDKYFSRIIADVTLSDGHDVGADLLLAGLAKPYDGGRKPREVCDAE
jgi:endonuclease YncB( thermonuclease family)